VTDTAESLRRRIVEAVSREPAPDRRAVRRRSRLALLGAGALVAALFMALGGPTRGERSGALTAVVAAAMVLIALAGLGAARKGASSRFSSLQIALALVLPTSAYGLTVLLGRAADTGPEVPVAVHATCALLTTLLSAPTVLALLFAARRSEPFGPARTSAWLAAAGTAVGVVLVMVHCPSANLLHDLVGHALPAVVPAAIGSLVGRRLVRP